MKRRILLSVLFCFLMQACFAGGKNKIENGPANYIVINGVEATSEAFQQMAGLFGKAEGKRTAIGVGFIISYFQEDPVEAVRELKAYLTLSELFDIPVVVQIDGESWWKNRPDLWNWWDKNKPGYHPENKNNVEWSSWTPDSAVQIGWRNWGRQMRVLPMPNLMSKTYRQACYTEMGKLIPIIKDWWNGLPEKKKYLLIGIKVGWESSIGVNNYYYPNGNVQLNQPELSDPAYGLKTDLLPGRGVQTIGYASVRTLGLASSGEMKASYLAEVIRTHLEDLSKHVSDYGIPRNRIFTHCGGWSKGETLYTAAVNQYSCPGWSFYGYAENPRKDSTAMEALAKSDAPCWGAVEWLYMGDHTTDEWIRALNNTLTTSRLKYVCVYNWSDVIHNPQCVAAIRYVTKGKRK